MPTYTPQQLIERVKPMAQKLALLVDALDAVENTALYVLNPDGKIHPDSLDVPLSQLAREVAELDAAAAAFADLPDGLAAEVAGAVVSTARAVSLLIREAVGEALEPADGDHVMPAPVAARRAS